MNESEILPSFLIVRDEQWINYSLLGYFAVVIGGGAILILNLLKILLCDLKCNGVLYFLLQFLLVDAFSLVLCYLDVTALISNFEWIFGNNMCSIFVLFSNFSSSATVYFVLTINLHVLSTANLSLNLSHVIHTKEEKNEFLSEEFDSCSGTYDTLDHKRTLTIDYSSGSRWKTSVNVFVPNLIVYLMALFLSLPPFVVSLVGDSSRLCTPKRFSHDAVSIIGLSEIVSFFVIKTFLPVLCIIGFTLTIAVNKLRKVKDIDETLVDEDPRKILTFAMFITCIFIIFQAPKLCIDAISLFLGDLNLRTLHIILSLIYYFGTFVRLSVSRILIKNM